MKMPSPTWTCEYRSDRRKHSHRCFHCNRIIGEGETVTMARVPGRKTRALHAACVDQVYPGGFTVGQILEAHGLTYLAGCGYAEARRLVDEMPIFKVGGAA